MLGIPESRKIPGGQLKHLLKRSVRGLIPDEIIDRPKQGFGVPVTEWLLGRLGSRIRETLTDFCAQTDFLDAAAVQRLVDRRDQRVWYLYNFAMWWNGFVRGSHEAPPVRDAMGMVAAT